MVIVQLDLPEGRHGEEHGGKVAEDVVGEVDGLEEGYVGQLGGEVEQAIALDAELDEVD
eukprot:CAMPEP_0173443360 /NCGR_PEP_ID=MMETSP1357-20121228/29536_1 /TAXON_ID=77926 /ORGANISM="Hemiselmis rufescens, Strain PCC563" /LENGTH=58 /DNA_ID=CAMNT_0014409237 /DNA_START=88 /DNA_END=264 /DNA_ORIENTATION=-